MFQYRGRIKVSYYQWKGIMTNTENFRWNIKVKAGVLFLTKDDLQLIPERKKYMCNYC